MRGVHCFALMALFCVPAPALEHTARAGDVSFAVYAPDWTWRKRDINILVVLRNEGEAEAMVGLELVFPSGKEGHFAFDGEPRTVIRLPAGETHRAAFTGITALDSVARQDYDFWVGVAADGERVDVPYPTQHSRNKNKSKTPGGTVKPPKFQSAPQEHKRARTPNTRYEIKASLAVGAAKSSAKTAA